MIQRCYNPKVKQYKDYGGRGIKVCPQWKISYRQFYTDMAPKPKGHTLDRIDNNLDYSPENCKWSTRKEQQRNRRGNVKVILNGIEFFAMDLAKLAGIKTDTVVDRVKKGFSYKDVVSKKRLPEIPSIARKLGAKKAALTQRLKTHCRRGHEFSLENTYVTKGNTRVCRKCDALRARGLHK